VPPVIILTLVWAPTLRWVAAGAAVLAAVSLLDDRAGLPARVRFLVHLAVAAALVALFPTNAPWFVVLLTPVALVWLINLYNFMDGADGLAGGMALFGFGGYAFAALTSANPDPQLAFVCAAIAGAAAGFLLFNFHPARIFLGDAGSIPLGFFAGALGYWGWRGGVWPVWFPALVFAPFIADASVTLLHRLARGEKFWQAHREHYYQRMVRLGLGHARTARTWYLLMVAGITIANWAVHHAPVVQWAAVIGWAAVLALAGLMIDRRWRRFAAGQS
jgi:UDP-N-acetylmuramyl pentapeptide phosphotransferase/UDP-N-acetylglucosamine-1-phosphate transferase